MGDRVLVGVAQSLRACVRPGDLVGRLAGDEFVVVAENLQRDEARRMAERITRAVSRPLEVGEDREIVITASVGVTVAADGRDAGEVLRDADVAMYREKLAEKAGEGERKMRYIEYLMRVCEQNGDDVGDIDRVLSRYEVLFFSLLFSSLICPLVVSSFSPRVYGRCSRRRTASSRSGSTR